MVTYKNTAYPPPPPPSIEAYHYSTPTEEYDLYFSYAVPSLLESNKVKLVPFIPSLHAKEWFDETAKVDTVKLLEYIPYGPFQTINHFLTWLEFRIRRDNASTLFAVYPGSDSSFEQKDQIIAVVGYLCGDPVHKVVEIGHITILPKAQGSGVSKHIVALLMKYAFESMKVRRVQWYCHHDNIRSARLAISMGLKEEAVLKWNRVIGDKPGVVREGEKDKGRHSRVLALGWDEWEQGVNADNAKILGS